MLALGRVLTGLIPQVVNFFHQEFAEQDGTVIDAAEDGDKKDMWVSPWTVAMPAKMEDVRLMEEIRLTSWYSIYPINYRVLCMSGG